MSVALESGDVMSAYDCGHKPTLRSRSFNLTGPGGG